MNTTPLPFFPVRARSSLNPLRATRRRRRLSRWLTGLAIAGVWLQWTLPTASADVMVSASAGGPEGNFEVTGNSSDFSGASHLHATATSSGSTSVQPGSLGSSGAAFPHGAGRAEANGSTGMLRASGGTVVASGGFGGGATAVIWDTITFFSPNPEITVYLDGSLHATTPGHAEMEFSIFIPGNGMEATDTLLLGINAFDSNGRYHTVSGALATDPSDFTQGVPEVFQYTLAIPPAWLQFFGNTFSLGFSLTAAAHDEDSGHPAYSNFENTARIGIKGSYASANGYTYLGFAPATPVPDSAATLTLLGSAVLGLGLMAKARPRRESV